jgi:hypothetical protein
MNIYIYIYICFLFAFAWNRQTPNLIAVKLNQSLNAGCIIKYLFVSFIFTIVSNQAVTLKYKYIVPLSFQSHTLGKIQLVIC